MRWVAEPSGHLKTCLFLSQNNYLISLLLGMQSPNGNIFAFDLKHNIEMPVFFMLSSLLFFPAALFSSCAFYSWFLCFYLLIACIKVVTFSLLFNNVWKSLLHPHPQANNSFESFRQNMHQCLYVALNFESCENNCGALLLWDPAPELYHKIIGSCCEER